MQGQESSDHFSKSRDKTDKSLCAERQRTDASLTQHRKLAENEADKTIDTSRTIADSVTSRNRTEADLARAKEQKSLQANALSEPKRADNHLRRERQRADQTIQEERARADTALKSERGKRRAAEEKLLSAERKATDKDLAYERQQSDVGIEHSGQVLANEQIAHANTRVQLTSRDEFLAIVSHDLRNPLGAISSAAELILQYDSPDEIKQYAELVKRNANIALRLISDLLDMERISAGKLDLQIAQQDVGVLIRSSIETLQFAADAKAIVLNFASAIKGPTYCDADRIRQVLANLLGNAIKFTPEGGAIAVRTLEKNSELQISISDTGPGIPHDKINAIFERFSQLGHNDRNGLGLGLFISRKIVEAHQGSLWVTSEVGKGTTFSFTLPSRRSDLKSA